MPVAIITGASRGLGRALAAALAERGWDLVLDARTAEALQERGGGAGGDGTRVTAVPGDVTDAAHRAALVAAARELGGLDLLVNNAGALGAEPLVPLAGHPLDGLREALETNVVAALGLVQEALPLLRASAAGAVLNISSDAAVEAYATWGGYGATQGGTGPVVGGAGGRGAGAAGVVGGSGRHADGHVRGGRARTTRTPRPAPPSPSYPRFLRLLDRAAAPAAATRLRRCWRRGGDGAGRADRAARSCRRGCRSEQRSDRPDGTACGCWSRARSGEVAHHAFAELPGLLRAGDVLVVNTSRTLPAALDGRLGQARGGRALLHAAGRRALGRGAADIPTGAVRPAPWAGGPAGVAVALPAGVAARPAGAAESRGRAAVGGAAAGGGRPARTARGTGGRSGTRTPSGTSRSRRIRRCSRCPRGTGSVRREMPSAGGPSPRGW